MIENLEIITVIMNTLKNILLKNNSPTIIKKLGKYRLHIVNKDIIYEINVFKGNHCIINSTYRKSTGDFVNSKLCDQFDEKLTNDELDEIARLLFDYEQKLLIGFSDLTEKLNRINFSELDDKLDTYISKFNINPEAHWDGKSISLRLNKTNNFVIPCYQLNVYIEFLKTEYNIDEEKLHAFNNFLCNGQNHHKLFIYNTENNQLDKSIMYFPINQMKSYFRSILKLD